MDVRGPVKYAHDKYTWPDGLTIRRYDDGRIEIGSWDSQVAVLEVVTRRPGGSRGGAYIVARFTPQDAGERP